MDNIADQFLSELGNKLAFYRKKKNLSYRELAQLCSVDHSKISKIEKGQVNIQILTILELAKGLGIQPKKLFVLILKLTNEEHVVTFSIFK